MIFELHIRHIERELHIRNAAERRIRIRTLRICVHIAAGEVFETEGGIVHLGIFHHVSAERNIFGTRVVDDVGFGVFRRPDLRVADRLFLVVRGRVDRADEFRTDELIELSGRERENRLLAVPNAVTVGTRAHFSRPDKRGEDIVRFVFDFSRTVVDDVSAIRRVRIYGTSPVSRRATATGEHHRRRPHGQNLSCFHVFFS